MATFSKQTESVTITARFEGMEIHHVLIDAGDYITRNKLTDVVSVVVRPNNEPDALWVAEVTHSQTPFNEE